MSISPKLRDDFNRQYMEFFDSAERKRRWNPLRDVPWDKLDVSKANETSALCVETFCAIELFVPDYTSNGFELHRDIFGLGWFQACWGFEESRHALVFREYLQRSGLRSAEQYQTFEAQVLAKPWARPFLTSRQMLCYGALQECATYLIYRAQRVLAQQIEDEVLSSIYFYVSRDEAAHMGFYRDALRAWMEEDRDGTLEDLSEVVTNFRMPGTSILPDYQQRLGVNGVGISSQDFLEHGIFPTLRAVGTSRTELMAARRRAESRKVAAAPEAPIGLSRAVGA